MAAIVKNNEDAYKKAASQNRNRQHQPVRNHQRAVHGKPKQCVGNKRIDQLPPRPPQRGYLKSRDIVLRDFRCNEAVKRVETGMVVHARTGAARWGPTICAPGPWSVCAIAYIRTTQGLKAVCALQFRSPWRSSRRFPQFP